MWFQIRGGIVERRRIDHHDCDSFAYTYIVEAISGADYGRPTELDAGNPDTGAVVESAVGGKKLILAVIIYTLACSVRRLKMFLVCHLWL